MLSLLSAMLCCVAVSAQHKVEMIPFGNMDQWIDRQIKESGIIGGATKNVYAGAVYGSQETRFNLSNT